MTCSRRVADFPIGSVWVYSNNPQRLWPDRAPDAVFVVTEIHESAPFTPSTPLVFCLVIDDLNEVRSPHLGRICPFGLGSAMAFNSVRIA